MAKASTHHLVKSLAGPESGMPFEAKTCAILPVTLDTPMNRKFMPDADFSTWTPLPVIAQMLLSLVRGLQSFENGSLFKIVTANYETSFDKL
jgi:dihydropteridine reductase